MENERDMLARLAMMAAPNETYDLTREDRASIKFALAELAKARDEVERLRGGVISAMNDFQHGLPGLAKAKLTILLDGTLKYPIAAERDHIADAGKKVNHPEIPESSGGNDGR